MELSMKNKQLILYYNHCELKRSQGKKFNQEEQVFMSLWNSPDGFRIPCFSLKNYIDEKGIPREIMSHTKAISNLREHGINILNNSFYHKGVRCSEYWIQGKEFCKHYLRLN